MMFKEIYLFLKKQGFEVYSIGQHNGLCEKPYLVLRETGQSEIAGKNLINDGIELIIYYPMKNYSEVNNYINSVKKSMQTLKLKRVYSPNAVIIDDDKKAYTTFIVYKKVKVKE